MTGQEEVKSKLHELIDSLVLTRVEVHRDPIFVGVDEKGFKLYRHGPTSEISIVGAHRVDATDPPA